MLSLIIRFSFILFLCASTFLAGAAQAQTKIVVGLSTINSRVTPLWIAEEKGFFAKNGLEVLVVATRVSQPAIAALIAGELQLVFGGASSALGAFSGGADLRIIAIASNRLTYDLMARPGLRKPEDLRGKSFGVGAIGGALWMGSMLALEYFGLDASRDQISIRPVGDQTNNIQALEAGSIDATLLDGVFSYRLKQKGFPVLAEFYNANIAFAGQGVVATRTLLQMQPSVAENFLRGLLAEDNDVGSEDKVEDLVDDRILRKILGG